MPAPAHVQFDTLQRFLDAWKQWDAEKWLATLTDDFTQVVMPSSAGFPARSRSDVERELPKLIETVTNYKLTVHETLHDAEKNKAAVYCASTGDTPFGPWNMEYFVFITFNESGDKVASMEEMIDSAFMRDFVPKFIKHLQEKAVAHR